jgi:hypothetical protein
MTGLNGVVIAVSRLASDHALGTMSPVELVERSGYRGLRSEVTVERLADCLAQHPDWVSAWLDYSEDKRSSPGWYIEDRDATETRVGYYEGPSSRPPTPFDDKLRACAEFVRLEVDDIAGFGRPRDRS